MYKKSFAELWSQSLLANYIQQNLGSSFFVFFFIRVPRSYDSKP